MRLHCGLLWCMESRTPVAAALEWETAKDQFRVRTGWEPLSAYVGQRAFDLLDQGAKQGTCRCILADNFNPWMIMVTGDDPVQRQIGDLMAEAAQLSEALELAPDAALIVCENYRREHGYELTTDEMIAAVRETLRGG